MPRIRAIAATVLTVAMSAVAASTPAVATRGTASQAAAAPGVARAGEGAALGLMITPLPGGTPSSPRVVTLTCDPVGGTHPRAAEACEQLAAANGDIKAVPYIPRPCPPVWEPVTVTARGTWRGQVIDYTVREGGVACANVSHGVIFWF